MDRTLLLSQGVYAQILCEGQSGEALQLTYLRPDTNWRDEPVNTPLRPNRPGVPGLRKNGWDTTSKSGVAFFPASSFASHQRFFSSPVGASVVAEVDDIHPNGNRIFPEIVALAVTLNPVPDLKAWLLQHPKVATAIEWHLNGRGSCDFSQWPQTMQPDQMVNQQDLLDAFTLAWNYSSIALQDPPPNLVDFDTSGTVIDEAHAWPLYVAHVAHCLAVEIGGRVPWRLTDYSDDIIASILHSGYIVRPLSGSPIPNVKCYAIQGRSVPAPPSFVYSLLVGQGLIDQSADPVAARRATIANVVNWCRDNLQHFYGDGLKDDMVDIWGYPGHPPASRVIEGTISTANPELGTRHYTYGCWGTTDFLQTILRTVNISVEMIVSGGHAMPHFRPNDLYLSHGDDPYNELEKCTPSFPADEMIIDSATFNGWLGPNLSKAAQESNVGRRAHELCIQYLPDYMLHMHYQDKVAGLSPDQGSAYKNSLKYWYPNFSDVPADLWQRMDEKLQLFGYGFIPAKWRWPFP